MREDVRRELHKAAAERRTVTYGFLMKRFHLSRGAPRGNGIVGVIGAIDRQEARVKAPGFAAIVVRKDTGYPGGGFFCWDGVPPSLRRPKNQASDPRLSVAQKNHIKRLQESIWAFYESV